jgi:peptidoglycan/xylan/chitin deacetylase (PgdA/CDA1 family)
MTAIAMTDTFVSLMYHDLLPGTGAGCGEAALSPSITSYFVSEQAFAQHLDALETHADVLSHEDVLRFHESGADAPSSGRPRIHLTFDDGWKRCVELGGPLLEARGWEATLFVTTELIGRPHFVNENDLRSIDGRSFHIGSHARTHCFLNELPEAAIREELRASKSRLEDITGRNVVSVSIPNGAVDARVRRLAAEAGYRLVFTSAARANSRRHGPLDIGRIAVRNTTTAAEVASFARGHFGRERLRQQLLSLPKRLLGARNYRILRRTLLGETRHQSEMHDLV